MNLLRDDPTDPTGDAGRLEIPQATPQRASATGRTEALPNAAGGGQRLAVPQAVPTRPGAGPNAPRIAISQATPNR